MDALKTAAAKGFRLARFRGITGPALGFGGAVLLLAIFFCGPLFEWVRFSFSNELYSHLLSVPFLSGYLVWLQRGELVQRASPWTLALAVCFACLGLGFLGLARTSQGQPPVTSQDQLCWSMLSFATLVLASGTLCFGASVISQVAWPAALLFFMAPFPKGLENAIELFFQHTSAGTASALFEAVGTPLVRQGLFFHLPGIVLQVGPECSGIRSSLVLLITSIVAGCLFLRKTGCRVLLAALVVPLAILRNGFRVFVIGLLCVYVDPSMIDSWIHRKGGPVFFALSLVPFFAALAWLRRFEGGREKEQSKG